MYKNLGVCSWHDLTQEKKPLTRRHRGVPDVYPQEQRQEEDSMNPQRLKSGYISIIPPYEQDSMFKIPRIEKFFEDGLMKVGKMVSQVQVSKNDSNCKTLIRQRTNKDGSSSQQFIHNTKTKERSQWFVDLARLKSFLVLAKKPPYVKRKEECFDLLFEYGVPIPRAIWFLKLHAVSHMANSTSSKGKQKTPNDLVFPELSAPIIRVIGDTVVKLNDFSSSDSSRNITYWNYLVNLFKHSYEDGMVDRQEFLMELAELLQAQAHYPMDKPFAFRFLLFFFCHYIKTVTQNMILARRVAHIVASRLCLYKMEHEKRNSDSSNWYKVLLDCKHHRPIIYSLTGLMHAIVLDCPQALIWNSFEVSTNQWLPKQLCGSPLDVLPCTPDELPLDLPPGPKRDAVISTLQSKLAEIKRRSWRVKRLWALNSSEENVFTLTVGRVLAIITALDMTDITQPFALKTTFIKVFQVETAEQFEYQTAITIKLLIQWAVTAQRGGTYRVSIVIALIKLLLERFNDPCVAPDTTIQDVLMEYLTNESPEVGSPHVGKEYANLMLLFYDLQRAGIFSHDKYVQDLIRSGELNQAQPVMLKLKDGNAEDKENVEDKESVKEVKEESVRSKSEKSSRENAKTELIDDEPDHHILMSKNDNLTRHERFLIQLPIQQIEPNRSQRNQRLVMLYGIGEDREQANQSQKRIADSISKIWQKKVNIEVPDAISKIMESNPKDTREPRFRRKPAENYADCIATFKTQTYYDQHVIAALCATNFMDMFREFVFKGTQTLPTAEGLDVLFYLLEYSMNITEITSISMELIPYLVACEKLIGLRQIPIIPGSLAAQHGHVMAAYLSSHYEYFLMHADATNLLRMMFRMVEASIRGKDVIKTAWARSVSVFVLQAKADHMRMNNGVDRIGVGRFEDLKNVFPSAGENPTPSSAASKYPNGDRESAFSEMMKDLKSKRFMNCLEFKKKLALLNQPGAGVPLVVAAYNAARESGRKIEVLSDIATLVAHFAANKSIEGDIYAIIDELCCSQYCKDPSRFLPVSSRLKTDDIEQLYAMATLTALLAAKHCISGHALILRLLQGVFKPFTYSPFPGTDKLEHMYRGLILGTFIISMLICGTDLPFCVDPVKQDKPQDRITFDIRGIRTLYIREFNDTLMSVLTIMILVAEPNKADDERASSRTPWFKAPQYTTFIQPILRASIRAICEQDWVNRSVFKTCESGKLDTFAKLKNQQGQKIIRLVLRRKCERELKEELSIDHTVKMLVTKLFSSMNVWNIRAIIYDIRLMIKENEKNEKGKDQFTHNQMLHFYDNLTQNIALACREFFLTLSPEKEKQYPEIKVGRGFQLNQVNPLWLIAPLMQTCPQPGFRSTVNHINVNSVQQKFLKEAQGMLSYQNDQNRTWLLSQKPFLNLLYASLTDEDQLRDGLVGSVLKQFSEIANRARDSGGLSFSKQFKNEREGLIVRLALCGGMFESMLGNAEVWAFELFKLLFYEVITEDRDSLVYEMCYDMLSTLIIYTIVENHQNFDGEERSGSKYSPQDEQSNQSSSLPNKYRSLMKKLSKEIIDRSVPTELNDLFKLLPVPKPFIDVPVVDVFGSPPAATNSKGNSKTQFASSQASLSSSSAVALLRGPNARFGSQYSRREQLTTFDFVQGYFAEHLSRHWKWSWFQGMKLDKVPMPMQRQVLRMLYHTHYLEYSRPALVGQDRPPRSDIFLTQPATEEAPVLPHNAPTPGMHGPMSVGPPQAVPPMNMAMGMMGSNAAGPSVDPSQMVPGSQGMMPPGAVPTSMQQAGAMHAGFPGPHGMPHPGMQGPGGMPGPHPDFAMRAPFGGKPMAMMGKPGMHPVGMPMRGGPHQQVRQPAVATGGRKRTNASGTKANSKRRKDSKAQVQQSMAEMQMSGPGPTGYWPNTSQTGFPAPQQGFMGQPGAAGGPSESHGQDSKAQLHEMILKRQNAQNAFGPGGPGGAPPHAAYPMMSQPDHQGGFTQSSGQPSRYM